MIERCGSAGASLSHSRTLWASIVSGAMAAAVPAVHRSLTWAAPVRWPPMTELAFAGAAAHARMIASGEVSSRELTELFLRRIERLDPIVNAFRVVMAEKALAQADQADGRRRAGDQRPLLGVPLAIKDDCDVAGEITAFGCDVEPVRRAADAEGGRRLRGGGARVPRKKAGPRVMITPVPPCATYGGTPHPPG